MSRKTHSRSFGANIAIAAAVAAPFVFSAPTSAAAVVIDALRAANPLAAVRFYVDPGSKAQRQVDAWRKDRPQQAAMLQRIADQPAAFWFGDWNRNVERDARSVVQRAASAGAVPVMVAYNIPQRDCGSHSAGGAGSAKAYASWIGALAKGIRGSGAVVILEPDALAGMDCLSAGAQRERTAMIASAVRTLKVAGASVYLDAGHSRWHSADEMAARLRAAGIESADGFSLNVSNFQPTRANIAYGEQVSKRTGGKHFVIDTSRNGAGTAGREWCNPGGQALGEMPSARTGHPLVDAYLWVKRPGESDGRCNGGPRAGEWWVDYALGLAQRQPATLAMAD